MPALPWLDGRRPRDLWRHAAARRLRELAERLERPLQPDGGAGAAVVETGREVGTGREVETERPTPVRRLDISGAPEHWVRLLRDAGLVATPPNPRSDIPPASPNPRSHIPPTNPNARADISPSDPNARSDPGESRPDIVSGTGAASPPRSSSPGPVPRMLPRLMLGSRLQRPTSTGSLPDRAAGSAASISWPHLAPPAIPVDEATIDAPAAPAVEAVSPHAPQAVRPVLRLRGIPLVIATDRPATRQVVFEQAVPTQAAFEQAAQRQEAPTRSNKTSPPHASPPIATPPNPITAQPATMPQLQPPDAARAVVVRPDHPRPEHPNAERQGHPSTTTERNPASPLTGNWPELRTRPAAQPAAERAATEALARAARLSNEQLAV